jgi:mycothiol synthase
MVSIRSTHRLDQSETDAVMDLVNQATDADGFAPLSEHVLLHLRHGGDEGGQHFLASDREGTLVAYAHLDTTDAVNGPSAELAVDPRNRRAGVGRAIVTSLIEASADGGLRLWAHGESDPAGALARSLGFTNTRVLWQMRRSLLAPLPSVTWPEGVSVRTFRPGEDDDEWLALNTRAFAHHPEQGEWAMVDLQQRIKEPWFSAPGFLIAEDPATGAIAGFHWTKVHGAGTSHGHEPIGEVYVVGVDPGWHGRGLGRALTVAGLQYLRSLGLGQAMLYVEATNTPAIRLYESLAFTRWDTDVMYQILPHT